MSTKTRVVHVRVIGFSAMERQMLNSIFLLSVAPARQIGYKLWNPDTGTAPDMYLLDGDGDNAVGSWQTTFASTADRTLVVGAKNTDLGVASCARPLGLKVVGAMDRLAIALSAREPVAHDVSGPGAATLPAPRVEDASPVTHAKHNLPPPRPAAANPVAPALAASHGAPPITAAGTMTATPMAAASGHALGAMTAAAPAAAELPNVTLTPNVAPVFDRSINEKPVPEKTVDRILSDKQADPPMSAAERLQASGVTPLSPSALSAAVAPSPGRANLRVVGNGSTLSASLPGVARADKPAASPAAAAPASSPNVAPAPAAPAEKPVAAPVTPAAAAPVAPAPAVVPTPAPAPVTTPTPISAAPVPASPVAPASAPAPRHEEHNFRVLAVDDSPLMRTFLQNKLQPYGIQPEFASSGEEALFKISKQHFDMIFLDVMLPGMDGYDVCKMIKKNKDNSLMKVVMLTSKDKTFDKIRGTMAGCDGYLTKPVDELKLRAIIERHSVAKK